MSWNSRCAPSGLPTQDRILTGINQPIPQLSQTLCLSLTPILPSMPLTDSLFHLKRLMTLSYSSFTALRSPSFCACSILHSQDNQAPSSLSALLHIHKSPSPSIKCILTFQTESCIPQKPTFRVRYHTSSPDTLSIPLFSRREALR